MGRPYLIASMAVHAIVLALLYYFGSYEPTLGAEARQLAASADLDRHAAMRSRVADMEQMKALMRDSLGESDTDAPDEVRFDATTTEEPGELLKRAEALAKDIDAMDEKVRAEEYAKATGVEKEEAARQLATAEQAPATGAAASASASASSAASEPTSGNGQPATDPAATAERVAALEGHMRDVLSRRQRQLERAQQGSTVSGGIPGAQGQDRGGAGGAGGVADRIAAYMQRDTPIGRPGKSGHYGFGDGDLFDHGTPAMTIVDKATMHKRGARTLGAGGPFANRVYVNSWYLIGPFAGRHGRDMFATDHYPPEKAVVLDAVYRGKDNKFLTWRYVESARYPLVPPDMQEDSVYYGYTELMMDSARDLAVWVGADDDVQLWINDRLEWKGGNVNKLGFFNAVFGGGNQYAQTYNLNEGKVLVHFRKGRNKLFFKLSNGPNAGFVSVVLTPL